MADFSPLGAGPGAITPDGCAVEVYSRLPDLGEAAIVHEATTPGGTILELGSGAGRVTHALLALGHQVVAVDESPDMLSRVRGAETVPARIDGLSLHRTFDAVLLASHLVNAPDVAIRAAFLATCRRHAADDGCVIIQQHDPDWYASATQTQSTGAGFTFRLKDVSRPGPGLVAATVEYESEQGEVWTHSFTTAPLGEDMLLAELADAGLRLDRYLTASHTWVRAVPVR